MKIRIFIGAASLAAALIAILGAADGPKLVLPIFQVDANFPTMPDHMEMGGVGGVNAAWRGRGRPHSCSRITLTRARV